MIYIRNPVMYLNFIFCYLAWLYVCWFFYHLLKPTLFPVWVARDVRSNKWKEIEIGGLDGEQCLGRLGYTLFFSYPQSKHKIGNTNFCQTRFGPNFDFYAAAGPTVVSWVSIDPHRGFVWCHPTPSSLPLHMFPPSGELESPQRTAFAPTKRKRWYINFDFFREGGDFTVVNPVSNIDLYKCCVGCHWTLVLFHKCRVCHSWSVTFPR